MAGYMALPTFVLSVPSSGSVNGSLAELVIGVFYKSKRKSISLAEQRSVSKAESFGCGHAMTSFATCS
jgi:hypothetical protein